MQASNFGGTFDQLFLWIFLWKFYRRCPSAFSIPWCKKVKNDQNSNQGGPAVNCDPCSAKYKWHMLYGNSENISFCNGFAWKLPKCVFQKTCVNFGCSYGNHWVGGGGWKIFFALIISSFKLWGNFQSVAEGVLEQQEEVNRGAQTQTQTQTYLFRQDCRKSKVHYLSRLRSCEEGREQEGKLEISGRINKDSER